MTRLPNFLPSELSFAQCPVHDKGGGNITKLGSGVGIMSE